MSPFLQKFFQAFRARQQEPHSWSEVVVQSLDYVGLFATPWTAECQAFLPFTVSRSVLKLMSTEGQTLNLCKDKGCESLVLLPRYMYSDMQMTSHIMGQRAEQ